MHAFHSTLHVHDDGAGAAAGLGGYNVRDWTRADYGPGARCIDTNMPFQVAASFPVDTSGVLEAMTVTLSQEGHSCPLSVSLGSYHFKGRDGIAELSSALTAGMTPIVSHWSSKDLLWLDGQGPDLEGPCERDKPAQCSDTVRLYDFAIEPIGISPFAEGSAAPARPVMANTTTGTDVSAEVLEYNCSADVAHWQLAWSAEKLRWCCEEEHVGCPFAPAPETGCAAVCFYEGHASKCDFRIQWVASSRYAGIPNSCESALDFVLEQCPSCSSCSLQEASCSSGPNLTVLHGEFSNRSVEVMVPMLTPEASDMTCEGGFNEELAWTTEKRAWCCEHRGQGCAPSHALAFDPDSTQPLPTVPPISKIDDKHDCGATNLDGSTTGHGLDWMIEKRQWCCQHESIGCIRTTLAPPKPQNIFEAMRRVMFGSKFNEIPRLRQLRWASAVHARQGQGLIVLLLFMGCALSFVFVGVYRWRTAAMGVTRESYTNLSSLHMQREIEVSILQTVDI